MPWPRKTSTCRSFVTISSGLCRLFAIVVLLHGQNHTSRWTRSMGVDQPDQTAVLGWPGILPLLQDPAARPLSLAIAGGGNGAVDGGAIGDAMGRDRLAASGMVIT